MGSANCSCAAKLNATLGSDSRYDSIKIVEKTRPTNKSENAT